MRACYGPWNLTWISKIERKEKKRKEIKSINSRSLFE